MDFKDKERVLELLTISSDGSSIGRCVCKNLLTVQELSWLADVFPVCQLLHAVQTLRVEQVFKCSAIAPIACVITQKEGEKQPDLNFQKTVSVWFIQTHCF